MSDVNVIEAESADPVNVVNATDRRRPGRLAYVSPELVPILRGEAPMASQPEPSFGEHDQLMAARGLPLAIALSAALWAGIAYVGHLFLS